jgi:hypothetical protein
MHGSGRRLSSLEEYCLQPCCMLYHARLWHTASCHHQSRQLWMKATRAIRDPREVSWVKRGSPKEAQHAIIRRWSRQLQEVIDQGVPPATIRMQEAA